MATISEAGSDENNRQISEVCDTSLISNEVNVNEGNISEPSLLNLKQNIFEEDSTNSGNIKEGNIESTMLTDERSQTNFERNTGSDIVSMNETDGNSENQRTGYIQDEGDNEIQPSRNIQLLSCNQQPGNIEGGFLKMEVDGDVGLKVTTTGSRLDPHALWVTHYTIDEKKRQVVIFENERCSELKKKTCVLYTHQAEYSQDFILVGKALDAIPERLVEIEPSVGFLKQAKSLGSELLYLTSMLSTDDRKLLVGFDAVGQPIPMNNVKKYSPDCQAYFRILEAA